MATEQIKAAAPQRTRRGPIAVRNKLSIAKRDPNYHYRIVNDRDSRIEDFIEQGYEVVTDAKVGDKRVDNAAPIGSNGSISVGGGVRAVTMRIRKDWYEEDQQIKQAEIDKLEQTMNAEAKSRT
jgi:hypothetical protein